MIEEIMKAVKRNNKRRGVNITIGTIVGFLLLCTSVMGAAIEIAGDGDKFTVTEITENTFENNIYTNNGKIKPGSGEGGIKISGTSVDKKLSFENNGVVDVKSYEGMKIDTNAEIIGKITNNGIISSSAEGIKILGKLTADKEIAIENNGSIVSKGTGILIKNNVTGNIINEGTINSKDYGIHADIEIDNKRVINKGYLDITSTEKLVAGIVGKKIITPNNTSGISNSGTIKTAGDNGTTGISITDRVSYLYNGGVIKSTDSGITIKDGGSRLDVLHNVGVIYGKTNAVKGNIDPSGTGVAMNNENKGLMISEKTGKNSILSGTDFNTIVNSGMAILVDSTGDREEYFLEKAESRSEVANAVGVRGGASPGAIIGTISINIENLDSDYSGKYIFNGISGTLKSNGTGNSKDKIIVNAYKTALLMADGSDFTTKGSVFNGGADVFNGRDEGQSETIHLAGNNTLNISQDSLVNGNMKIDGNSNNLNMAESSMNGEITAKGDNNNLILNDVFINGDISIDGDKNTLSIAGENTYLNGNLAASNGDNTVNLTGGASSNKSLNMFHDVDGFNNMNIQGGSVTFFEDSKVTGVKELTVEEDAVLNLRLKKLGEQTADGLEKAGHAFSDNGEMVMEGLDDGGTLKFITNGIGQGVYVDTNDMQIKNMIVETNSILDKYKFDENGGLVLKAVDNIGDMNQSGDKIIDSKDPIENGPNIFETENFDSIDGIYKGIYSSTGENLNALREIALIDRNSEGYNENMSKREQLKNLQAYLNEIYTQSPYTLSSELSRRSAGMFRDIVTENEFRPNLNKWMVMGGLTHVDGGTKDNYYGEVYQMDGKNSLNTEVDTKLTGAYVLGKYGYSENVALGVTVGGNRSEAELAKSKVKGNSGYIGAFAENYRGNLTLKAGAGIQYSEYDADRSTIGGHSYSDKYSDMTYDIYLNGRYSNVIGNNLFLEPYATLSYTYVDQEGADEGSKALAIETDSKSFDYTSAKAGIDLKKVIPHEKGKSTLSAGVSYTRLLKGADSEHLTGRFNGGNDFDILVAGKNEHSIGLNAKYTLELESGILFDVKGTYSVERDSHNDNAKNKNKGEWIVGAGLGYKF